VTASFDGTAKLWDPATGQATGTFEGHDGKVMGVAVSPDGKLVATASLDETVRLWDAKTRKEVGPPRGHRSPINSIEFLADGRRVLATSLDGPRRVFDAASGEEVLGKALPLDGVGRRELRPLEGAPLRPEEDAPLPPRRGQRSHGRAPDRERPSPRCLPARDRRALTSGVGPELKLWDVVTRARVGRFDVHGKHEPHCLVVSPDGSEAITASDDPALDLWDLSTAKLLATLDGSRRIGLRRLRPEVRGAPSRGATTGRSSSGTLDAGVQGKTALLADLPGHAFGVACVAFSSDGRFLVSGAEDGLRVWDVESRRTIATVATAPGRPDGHRVLAERQDVRRRDRKEDRPLLRLRTRRSMTA